jgi:hypothetical protein
VSSEQETEPQETSDRARTVMILLSALAELAYMAIVVWMQLLPEHRKQEIRMRAAATARDLLGRFAHRAGAAGIRAEAETGRQNYALPLVLSVLRDRAGDVYERARS